MNIRPLWRNKKAMGVIGVLFFFLSLTLFLSFFYENTNSHLRYYLFENRWVLFVMVIGVFAGAFYWGYSVIRESFLWRYPLFAVFYGIILSIGMCLNFIGLFLYISGSEIGDTVMKWILLQPYPYPRIIVLSAGVFMFVWLLLMFITMFLKNKAKSDTI